MTEGRWLHPDSNPAQLIRALHWDTAHRRAFQLWATAAAETCVEHWNGRGNFYRAALDLQLRYADDPSIWSELEAMRRRVREERDEFEAAPPDQLSSSHYGACLMMWCILDPSHMRQSEILSYARSAQRAFSPATDNASDRAHCHLIREIFGNPFRPLHFSPEWRTDTVLALAREMYESREFSAMPILADALQDAGCTSDDILNHCRAGALHVRGCWVVDLVLGKT